MIQHWVNNDITLINSDILASPLKLDDILPLYMHVCEITLSPKLMSLMSLMTLGRMTVRYLIYVLHKVKFSRSLADHDLIAPIETLDDLIPPIETLV